MSGPIGGAAQLEMPPPLQHAVEDGLGEIGVVEDPAPGAQRLVGREDHGALMQVALVDDVEEDVGRIRPIAQIADLVDHEDVGMGIGREDVAEPAFARGRGELVNEGGRRGEPCLEAILDGAVGDGDGEMGLAGAARPAGDETAALSHELGAEDAAEQGEADAGLEGEIKVLDGFQEREAGAPHAALNPGLGAVGHFLGDQQGEEVAVAEPVGLGPLGEVRIEAPDGGQMQAPEEGVEVDGRGAH